MSPTKIEWVRNPDGSKGFASNPIKGCLHRCFYCYSWDYARRFKKGNFDIDYSQFDRELNAIKKRRKPATIFMGSATELFGKWVPEDKIKKIIEVTEMCPQHTFLFLTKNPIRYAKFDFPDNCWIGATITGVTQGGMLGETYARCVIGFENKKNTFISYEPLMGSVIGYTPVCDWIIVGTMTGKYARQYQTKKEWIDEIVRITKKSNIPLFIKDNVNYPIHIQEFPRGKDKRGGV